MANMTLLDFLICFGRSIYRLIGLFSELSLLTFKIPIVGLSQFRLVTRVLIACFSIGLILMTINPQQINSISNENDDDRKLFCASFERRIHQGFYPPIISDNYSIIFRKIAGNNSQESITLISVPLDSINIPRHVNILNNYSNTNKEAKMIEHLENLTIKLSCEINHKESFNVIANKLCGVNKEVESEEFIIEAGSREESQPRDSDSSGNKINWDINSLVGKIIESDKTEQVARSFDDNHPVSQDSSDTFVGINELTPIIPSAEINKIALKSKVTPINSNNNNNEKEFKDNEEEIEKVIVVINPDSVSEITEDTVVSENSSEEMN